MDFSRTPEHAYPVQVGEVLAAIRWLRRPPARGGAARDIILFGESAGATLCLSAVQALRDEGEPGPAGMVLFYANAAGPQPGSRAYSQWVWRQYLGHLSPAERRRAIPLLAGLHALPPMWLGVGSEDPLVSDSESLAAGLEGAGVAHRLKIYPGLPHGFVMLSGLLEPAAAALREACAAVGQIADRAFPPLDVSSINHSKEGR